jgi:hypothetical protein
MRLQGSIRTEHGGIFQFQLASTGAKRHELYERQPAISAGGLVDAESS